MHPIKTFTTAIITDAKASKDLTFSERQALIEVATSLERCVTGYSKRKGCCQKFAALFYRIWNAIKAIFGKSDWDQALISLRRHSFTLNLTLNKKLEKSMIDALNTLHVSNVPYCFNEESFLKAAIQLNEAGLNAFKIPKKGAQYFVSRVTRKHTQDKLRQNLDRIRQTHQEREQIRRTQEEAEQAQEAARRAEQMALNEERRRESQRKYEQQEAELKLRREAFQKKLEEDRKKHQEEMNARFERMRQDRLAFAQREREYQARQAEIDAKHRANLAKIQADFEAKRAKDAQERQKVRDDLEKAKAEEAARKQAEQAKQAEAQRKRAQEELERTRKAAQERLKDQLRPEVTLLTQQCNILNLNPKDNQLTQTKIMAAYRPLAKKHHPDRGGNPETFKTITTAKDYLIELATQRMHLLKQLQTFMD